MCKKCTVLCAIINDTWLLVALTQNNNKKTNNMKINNKHIKHTNEYEI